MLRVLQRESRHLMGCQLLVYMEFLFSSELPDCRVNVSMYSLVFRKISLKLIRNFILPLPLFTLPKGLALNEATFLVCI